MKTTTWDLTTEVTLKPIKCCDCGVLFAMPDYLLKQRRADSATFWCPNGHPQAFTETEATRQRRRAEELECQLEGTRAAMGSWRDQAEASERSLRAVRGHLTRAKNRARAGVCPVDECSRHFENLQRHIATKHPEFTKREADHHEN